MCKGHCTICIRFTGVLRLLIAWQQCRQESVAAEAREETLPLIFFFLHPQVASAVVSAEERATTVSGTAGQGRGGCGVIWTGK